MKAAIMKQVDRFAYWFGKLSFWQAMVLTVIMIEALVVPPAILVLWLIN